MIRREDGLQVWNLSFNDSCVLEDTDSRTMASMEKRGKTQTEREREDKKNAIIGK